MSWDPELHELARRRALAEQMGGGEWVHDAYAVLGTMTLGPKGRGLRP